MEGRSLGIQGRLLSFFLVVIVIPLPLLASIVYWRGSRVIKGQVFEQLAWVAAETRDKVAGSVFSAGEQATLLANLPIIRDYLRAKAFGLHEDMARQQSILREYFEQFLRDHPQFSQVRYVDADGRAITAAPARLIGSRVQAAWFREIQQLRAGEVYRGPLEFSADGRQAVMRFAAPIQQNPPRGLETESAQAAQELFGGFQEPEGLVELQMNLTELRAIIAAQRIGSRGRAMLLDADGRILARGDAQGSLRFQSASPNPALAELKERLSRTESGLGEYPCASTTCLVAYSTFLPENWKVAVIAPRADFTRWIDEMRTLIVIFTAVIFLAAVLAAVLFTRQISGPLQRMDGVVRRLAEGDFSVRVALARQDEIGRLAHTFDDMTERLRDFMAEEQERQRMQQELQIARTIQSNLLPQRPPDLPYLDLEALSLPAREVGGDYYDFFPSNGETGRLGVAIADASGKGVPASLLVSMTRSLLRSQLDSEKSPGEVVTAMNRLLLDDRLGYRNYVTFFYGEYDPTTQTLQCANAGQLYPLHRRGRDRRVAYVSLPGVPLGVTREANFQEVTVVMEPGDVLVLYTDGIVEAMDAQRRLYGFDRLEAVVQRAGEGSARQLIDAIVADVRAFATAELPDDDMTLVVMKFRGAGEMRSSSATLEGLQG